MKYPRLTVFCLLIVAAAGAARADVEPPAQVVIQQVVERVKPSLVRIHVVEGFPEAGREAKQESFGSGVIISSDGYVVTNHHVAGKARWLSCTLSSKQRVEAKLIGTDPLTDIALLKLGTSGAPYVAAQWGDSSKLRVGDSVLAMGSPFAFSQSVTAGIVSNTELILPASYNGALTLDGEDVGSIVRWIGHDAPIRPGNSGGPLVNLQGEIIGINEIEVGLSGAIPGNLAQTVAAQLKDKGRVARTFTGINLQPRLQQDTRSTGVLVSGVVPDSPAARAGIQPGDLLLRAGDLVLDAKFPEQLPLVNLELSRLAPETPVVLTLLRGAEEVGLSVSPKARDLAEAPSHEIKGWGVTCSDITPLVALEERYPDTGGALVTSILAGGPAAEAEPAISEGDVILSLGGKKVESLQQLQTLTAAVAPGSDGVATLVEIRRRGERLMTVVPINKENAEDTSIEVAKAWLPASVQVLTRPLAQSLGLPAKTQGVRVTEVYSGSAAEAAGLRVGDILTKIDDIEIEADQPEDGEVLPALIRQYKIGTTAKITVLRERKSLTVAVKLPQSPKQERDLARHRDDNFGLTVRSVAYQDRVRKNAGPKEDGALVVEVGKGSWAALADLYEGDIIHRIDGTRVADGDAAKAKLQSLEKERSKQVVFFVARGVHTLFIEVQTDWSLPLTPSDKPAQTGLTPERL